MDVRQKVRDVQMAARRIVLEALRRTARRSRNRAKYTRKAKHRQRDQTSDLPPR